MKIQVLLLAATLFALSASAQTKKIAHRSHSGSNRELDLSGDDNFGVYIKPDTSRHLVVEPVPVPTTPPSDAAKPGDDTKKHASSTGSKKGAKTKPAASKKNK
jgi:hypothetical protein